MEEINPSRQFGYKRIDADQKQPLVDGVFHSVSQKYDVMNDLMSLGIHRLWKHFAIEMTGIRPHHKVLDVASGTCDLGEHFAKIISHKGKLILSDINESMLAVGRDRMIDKGLANHSEFIIANAEHLPFAEHSFDCITISFGLRNVPNINQALKSMYACLKPGGRLVILEFSKPTQGWLNKLYDIYSFSVLPNLGQLIANDRESYQYLAESIRMHPNQETLKHMMTANEFERVEYHNLTSGIVAVHRGFKL